LINPWNWFFKPRIPANKLTGQLLDTFASQTSAMEGLILCQVPEEVALRYQEKMREYQSALLLMALSGESERRNEFAEAVSAYEYLVFGPKPTPLGLKKLEAIRSAMKELNLLLSAREAGRELTWSLNWFAREVSNPATLALFGMSWMTRWATIVKLLRDVRCG
jgi:hypothetical protein